LTSVVLNRILIVLGYVGMFISGFLSLGHLLKISLPCGVTKGCDVVATHPTSYLFGNSTDGGLPVAYLGFFGYLLLTLIALFRSIKGIGNTKRLATIGFVLSAAGALYSGYLTYVSIDVIHALCIWCLASAGTMILTAMVYAVMIQSDRTEGATRNGIDKILAGVLTVAVAVGLVGGGSSLKAKGETLDGGLIHRIKTEKIDLAGPGSHILGNPDGPVTVIEFADMLCASCKETFPVLEDLVKNSNGKVRLVFHHYPLFMKEDHAMAVPAATVAEIAGEKDRFWQFLAAFYSKQTTEMQTPDAVLGVAKSVGLDVAEVERRLKDANDPAIKRVTDDLNLANEIKINGTPTLFLQVKGGDPEQVVPSQLENKLNTEPYRSLIVGGAAGS
jgi:protein-disulfide isomerase/uncharacterized membrane protein